MHHSLVLFLSLLGICFSISATAKSTGFPFSRDRHSHPVVNRHPLRLGGATSPALSLEGLTNPEQIQRGLTPNGPAKVVRHALNGHARSFPDPTLLSPRSNTSPGPSTTGRIRVYQTDASGNQAADLGYVRQAQNNYNEYSVTSAQSAALQVKVPTGGSTPFYITAANGDTEYPYLGAIQSDSGRDDLAPDDWAYAYLGATGLTPANAAPTNAGNNRSPNSAVESSIWYYHSASKQITTRWVNNDGQLCTNTVIAYSQSQDLLVLTGDIKAFNDLFTEDIGNTVQVIFVFEPMV